MIKQLKLLGLACGLFLVAPTLFAQEVLNISSWAPPTHHMNAVVFKLHVQSLGVFGEGCLGGRIMGHARGCVHSGHTGYIHNAARLGIFHGG